jgi:hypothetical protein
MYYQSEFVQPLLQWISNKCYISRLYPERRVNDQRNILHEISERKANWIGHILRKNCLLRQVIERNIKGGIEVTERRGRRRRMLLDDLNHLTPNGKYSGCTASLTSRRCFLNVYTTNIRT